MIVKVRSFLRHPITRWGVNGILIIGIMYYLSKGFLKDLGQINFDWSSFKWSTLILALLLYGFTFIIFVGVWHLIIERLDDKSDLKKNVSIYCSTHFARHLPTIAWLIASRAYLYNKAGIRKRVSVIGSGIEIALHALAGGLVLLTVEFYGKGTIRFWAFPITLISIAIILWRPSILLAGQVKGIRIRRRDIISWVGLYTLTWIIAGPFFLLITQTFYTGGAITLMAAWRVWIMASLAAYVGSVFLGGAGILREFTLTSLLSSVIPSAQLLLVVVGSRLLLLLGAAIWSLIILVLFNQLIHPTLKEKDSG